MRTPVRLVTFSEPHATYHNRPNGQRKKKKRINSQCCGKVRPGPTEIFSQNTSSQFGWEKKKKNLNNQNLNGISNFWKKKKHGSLKVSQLRQTKIPNTFGSSTESPNWCTNKSYRDQLLMAVLHGNTRGVERRQSTQRERRWGLKKVHT